MAINKPRGAVRLRREHPLANGLVGCWIFNEQGGYDVIDLAYGLVSPLVNSPSWTQVGGGGVSFAKVSDQYVNVGDHAHLKMAGSDITIAVRYRLQSAPSGANEYQLVAKDSSGQRAYTLDITGTSGPWQGPRFYVNGGGGGVADETRVPQTADERHLVGRLLNGRLAIFVDGILKKDIATSDTIPSTTSNLMIARRQFSGSEQPFDGQINYVYIWNRGLSAEEIKWIAVEPYSMVMAPSTRKFILLSATDNVKLLSLPTVSGTILYPPSNIANETGLTMPTISGTSLFSPALAYAISMPVISATSLNPPEVSLNPPHRVTQVTTDVISYGDAKNRITQVTADVVSRGDPKIRVTQDSVDVLADGEFKNLVTQTTMDVIGDVVPHSPNVRVTQLSVDIIAEPSVEILTPSPLATGYAASAYSAFIVATGGLGAITFTLLSGTIAAATQTDPVVITNNPTPHGLTSGQRIFITDSTGMTELNGNYYYVDVLSPTTFAIYNDHALTDPVDGTGFGVYTGGGKWSQVLSPGLVLDAITGEITGTPTEAGTFTFNVIATDASGHFATAVYDLLVDSIGEDNENLNMGIGVFGLGYTIRRGLSGVECHFEFVDVGLGSAVSGPFTYLRSSTFFPRTSFPDDQVFYLEAVGGNVAATPHVWTITNVFTSQQYTLTIPANTVGRIRGAAPFEGPEGVYIISAPTVAVADDTFVRQFRIVAPLVKAQKFVSEVRLTQSGVGSTSDQTIGGPDVWRTSSAGREGLDDGWVPSDQPVWRFEAAAWERVEWMLCPIVMANASFPDQVGFKYSEIALVDLDDLGEFGFSRKISTKAMNVFLTPTFLPIDLNPAHMRDGHRYHIWARSVRPEGFFTFNTYLHTARIMLGMNVGNNAEIYNRCGPLKRIYKPGSMVPNPEIFFQVESNDVQTVKLRDMGLGTPLLNMTGGTGTEIPATSITSVAFDSVRTAEISAYLLGGHDYEAPNLQGELVHRFINIVRRRSHNYMF